MICVVGVLIRADARLALELDAGRDDRRVAALERALLDSSRNGVVDHLVHVFPLRAENRQDAPAKVQLADDLCIRRISNNRCFRAVTRDDFRRVAADGRRDDGRDVEFTRADMLIEAKNYANYVAKKNFFETRGIDFNTNATYENYGDMLKSGVDLSS